MILRISNVMKAFDDTAVLNGISLEVDKGDVVALLGPSGSGKTTLLRCMNCLEVPDSGELEFSGKVYNMNRLSIETDKWFTHDVLPV